MHEPDADLYAAIDRLNFERLKQTNPVYQHDPDTVIVSPATFERTPKVPRTPEQQEADKERRAAATAMSRVMHRRKARKPPRN